MCVDRQDSNDIAGPNDIAECCNDIATFTLMLNIELFSWKYRINAYIICFHFRFRHLVYFLFFRLIRHIDDLRQLLQWGQGLPPGSVVKNQPALQPWRTLQDPLEEGMATHSSILSAESHGQRSLAGHCPRGCRVDTNEVT